MSCHVPSCLPRLVEAWGARDAAVAPSAPCARAARLPAIVFEDERYGTPLARLRHAHDPKPGTIQLLRAARNPPAGPEPDPAEKRQAFPGLVPACQWGPGPTDSRSRIPFPARQSNLPADAAVVRPGRQRAGLDPGRMGDSAQTKRRIQHKANCKHFCGFSSSVSPTRPRSRSGNQGTPILRERRDSVQAARLQRRALERSRPETAGLVAG